MGMKRLLTKKEAAEYCGTKTFLPPVSPKRIRPGKQGLRYDVRDLDRWIDGLAEGEADEADWLAKLDDGSDASPGR
jgi:hypothetical protein